ncbi:hypothetical protein [Streptomyces sp. KLOTTS4A1]|uniref:hypothetical protein n=1 Tax=Streptomyces sp. KLOTTS4A1 TaxID=3390996 RepID=UPI0039F50197
MPRLAVGTNVPDPVPLRPCFPADRGTGGHLPGTDVLAVPPLHDTPDELAQPGGVVRDWKADEAGTGAGWR